MTTDNNQEILVQLLEAKQNNPGLAEVIDLQRDLLEAQMQLKVYPSAPRYSAEEVRARFEQGIPLLRPQEIMPDWGTFSDLYLKVCRTAARHRSDLSTQFDSLLKLHNDDSDTLRSLTTTYLENGRLDADIQDGLGELLAFVLNHTLRPFLQAYADVLASVIEQERWQRGHCPICGGEPDFAFLDDEPGSRHLVCSRCDSHWLYPRVKCPFCATSEPKHLSYYPSDDEKHRLYVCRNCLRYLKAIDLRKMRKRVLFPVARITTVALDLIARDKGFS